MIDWNRLSNTLGQQGSGKRRKKNRQGQGGGNPQQAFNQRSYTGTMSGTTSSTTGSSRNRQSHTGNTQLASLTIVGPVQHIKQLSRQFEQQGGEIEIIVR